jgi:hypothetical protein
MPLSTTSAFTAAILVEASGPAMISGRYCPSPAAGGVVDQVPEAPGITFGDADGAGPGVHGLPGEEFEVAAPGAQRHDLKKVGAPSTTSIACVPMEPVDPRMTMVRGWLAGRLEPEVCMA